MIDRTSETKPETPPAGDRSALQRKLYEIIFGHHTPAGISFDICLLVAILISVVCVCLNTVDDIHTRWSDAFFWIEWTLTALFTVEYLLRLYCAPSPKKYAFSFFGIVDLLAVLPSYLPLFISGYHTFAVVRALRLLRVFRILKLGWFVTESDDLAQAVYQARAKIVVFLSVILIAITIAGSLMYEIENPESRRKAMSRLIDISHVAIDNGYSMNPDSEQFPRLANELNLSSDELKKTLNDLAKEVRLPIEELSADNLVASEFSSIPQSMYWATVTMTTVGYGDIVPRTPQGKIVSALLILLGYSLIIVPTGFVSAEMVSQRKKVSLVICPHCDMGGHDVGARFCKHCGGRL